jgi:hypothetical protein
MCSFNIPTGTLASKNILTKFSQKWKAPCALAPKCRSITYDCKKEWMTWEWADHDEFLAWLAAKQSEKAIEFILYQSKKSDSPIWQECRMYWCGREYSSGKSKYQQINQWERMIPSKKMGCRCQLTIKQYPGIETIMKMRMIICSAMRICDLPDCQTQPRHLSWRWFMQGLIPKR